MHETLGICEDANKEFYIKGATEEIIQGEEDVMNKLRKGEGECLILENW